MRYYNTSLSTAEVLEIYSLGFSTEIVGISHASPISYVRLIEGSETLVTGDDSGLVKFSKISTVDGSFVSSLG